MLKGQEKQQLSLFNAQFLSCLGSSLYANFDVSSSCNSSDIDVHTDRKYTMLLHNLNANLFNICICSK